MLDLAGDLVGLVAAQQGIDPLVIGRIQGVDDGLGELTFRVQTVHEPVEVGAGIGHGDAVKAGVGTQKPEHIGVGVAHAAEVQLHGPAVAGILPGAVGQDVGLIALCLPAGDDLTGHTLLEGSFDFRFGCFLVHDVVQTVVGSPAAHRVEVVDALAQRSGYIAGVLNFDAGSSGQLFDVSGKACLVDVHGGVGTEGGADPGFHPAFFGDQLVPFQITAGIIGGADHGHVAHFDKTAGAEAGIGQLFVAKIPHFLGGITTERAFVAKEVLQFQMAPVVHGVADGTGQGFRKLLELLTVGGVAGDVVLGNTVGTHDTPLVVVAAQPDLRDVFKTNILINLLGIQMAVVVDDGHPGCVFVIQRSSRGVTQKKILAQKGFHDIRSFFVDSTSITEINRNQNCKYCLTYCGCCCNLFFKGGGCHANQCTAL